MAPMQQFPVVLRSDNAREFIGGAVAHINTQLEIAHLTGAAYHPQAQGTVERMHRKMNEVVRLMIEEAEPSDQTKWPVWLPFVEGHLRNMKMGVLGGRSPMNVVMGINPSLPATLRTGLITESVSAESYSKELLRYLNETHKRVRQYAEQLNFEKEGTDKGDPGATPLTVGDLVLLKTENRRKGEDRFKQRTDGEIYRISAVVGHNTYALGKLTTGAPPIANPIFANRYPAERLIRLDMPELELELPEGTPQRIEIFDDMTSTWRAASTERWAVDGRVSLRFDDNDEECLWLDLTKCRYRWLVGPVATSRAELDEPNGEA